MAKATPHRKVEHLAFDNGLEADVIVSPVPLGPYLDIVAIMEDEEVRKSSKGIRDLAVNFAPFVVSWNLDAKPSVDGIMSVDFNMALALALAWVRLVGSVPLPQLLPSNSTSTQE